MSDSVENVRPMSALDSFRERHAVRTYTAAQVDDAALDVLLDAAVSAPSSMNTQPWAFVVLQDPDLLDQYENEASAYFLSQPPPPDLASVPTEQLEVLRNLVASPDFAIFHGAPTVVVIYSKTLGGIADCFLAAENLMLAACAIGLGTCPVGLALPLFNRADVKATLNVPPGYVAALPITVGVPSGPLSSPPHDPPQLLCRR